MPFLFPRDYRAAASSLQFLSQYVSNIASQCRAAFYLGEKSDVDLTLSDGGAGHERNEDPDYGRSGKDKPSERQAGSKTNINKNTFPVSAASSVREMEMPTISRSTSDEAATVSENAGPSPASNSQARGPIGTVLSDEIFVPHSSVLGSSFERGSSTRGRQNNGGGAGGEAYENRSRERSMDKPKDNPTAAGGGGTGSAGSGRPLPSKVLSIRHRTQEDLVPRRRSKSRPGRGQSPIVKESQDSISMSPRHPLRQFTIENPDAVGSADVV